MVHIKCNRGLKIPIKGAFSEGAITQIKSSLIALDLSPFSKHLRIKPLKKVGESVKCGEKIAFDTQERERVFVASASGIIKSIIRGEKRRLLAITIKPEDRNSFQEYEILSKTSDSESVKMAIFQRGLSPYIWQRPFHIPIELAKTPKSIFVSALSSEPYIPSPHLCMQNEEENFQLGLFFLKKIAPLHLVYNHEFFAQFQGIEKHTIEGKHPIESHSIHIAAIDPIESKEDLRWTIKAEGVRAIGSMLGKGLYPSNRIIALSGEGINEKRRGLYSVSPGALLKEITLGNEDENIRLISGGPLTGTTHLEFLGFEDVAVSLLINKTSSSLLRFFRPGTNIYTATRAYLSKLRHKNFSFDTNRFGDIRAFVDKNIYQKVMPLKIPVEPFLKSLITKDFEMALKLGLLEISPEDFSLTEFICPSKISHMNIVRESLLHLYKEELW